MTGRLGELQKYIAMTGLDDVDEMELHSQYQRARDWFKGDHVLSEEDIDNYHAAYNTMVSAMNLFGIERSNLLNKIKEYRKDGN